MGHVNGTAVVGTVAAPTSPLDSGSGATLTTAGTAVDTGLPSDRSPSTVGSIPSGDGLGLLWKSRDGETYFAIPRT